MPAYVEASFAEGPDAKFALMPNGAYYCDLTDLNMIGSKLLLIVCTYDDVWSMAHIVDKPEDFEGTQDDIEELVANKCNENTIQAQITHMDEASVIIMDSDKHLMGARFILKHRINHTTDQSTADIESAADLKALLPHLKS